jgi:predicted dehydrogenase
MAPLKLLLIGAGHMGRLHAQKFSALPGVELAAVADVDRARAEALAGAFSCIAGEDWRAFLGSAGAAVVAVPTERHREIAAACLEAGLHVLVEKPIASTLEDAGELVSLAGRNRLVLQVGHVERYNAAFQALSERMARPLFIEAERLSGFKRRGADVDVILDLMIHDIDLALALCKAPVREVSACGFRVLTDDIDIANARLEFADGCVANLSASRVSQAPVRKLRVFQPDLYVSADLQGGRLRFVQRRQGEIEQNEERYEGGDALASQAAAFAAAIGGGASVPVSGESGRRVLELALGIGRLVRERLERFAAPAAAREAQG